MRILVVTRSYPSADDLYQYPFVHRRVLAYREAGHDVVVFRPSVGGSTEHVYEDVTCRSGDAAALNGIVADVRPDVIAAHGFSDDMWPYLKSVSAHLPVRAWLHGSEIPAFFRFKAERIIDGGERLAALRAVESRREFWRDFLKRKPSTFKLVHVSESAAQLFREDMALGEDEFSVVHNPIDTGLFSYLPKSATDRFRVLMIRPFDSPSYGNDLAVYAIMKLAERNGFDRLTFTIIGDGPMFDETLAPLRGLENVSIERRFLTQAEIVEQHRRHGIFLVPTRLDTQGVSRDEAMASGLVPVTNFVSAVPEFVDASCAGLAGSEDSAGLADALQALVADPSLFLAKSQAAAQRVRGQSGIEIIVPRELALLAEAAGCGVADDAALHKTSGVECDRRPSKLVTEPSSKQER